MTLKVLYFAWIKEKVGIGEEALSPPAAVKTVDELIDWICSLSPDHAKAFTDRDQIRVAVDQVHSAFDTAISGASEVAFFPPVTGG